MSLLPRRSNPAELRAFDAVCDRLAGFDPVLTPEYVDGFLAALASGPPVLEPGQWLPLLCKDAFDRAFADPEDHAQALRALRTRLAVLWDQLDPEALMDEPDALRLDPLMDEWTDALRQQLQQEEGLNDTELAELQTGAVWASGFSAGMQALPPLWPAATPDAEQAALFDELMQHAGALSLSAASEPWQAHVQRHYPDAPPDREQLITEACFAVQALRLWWFDHAPRTETRRVQAPPGRNDPCPCGSGRKYKKCHGAAA